MKDIYKIIKIYKVFIVLVLINIILGIFFPKIGKDSVLITKGNVLEMLKVIPPVFVLLGLLDVWVKKEVMIKYMGEKSGIKGLILAFLVGSSAAGPLYIAFPIAGLLLRKKASFFNVFIFIGAWSTTKIPMLLFEITNLGGKYALIRLCFSVVSIIIIAFVLNKTTTKTEKEYISNNLETQKK
ncbi:MAG: permease [Fusobacterium sp.]